MPVSGSPGWKPVRGVLACCAVLAAALTVLFTPTPVFAQSSASDYTSAVRYDAAGRAVGTIAPDPDGSGPLKHAATRTTIDNRGLVIKVETGELASWQSEAVLPENWTGFTVLSKVETFYDANRRKVKEIARGSDNVAISLTQYSYDNRGRLECTAVRMNSARWGASQLPASACTLGVEGNEGPDRITRTVYDAAGQVVQLRRGVGSDVEIADVTYSYTDNGQISQVIDANGNRAEQRYDDYDRQVRWVLPSKSRPNTFDASTPEDALISAGALNEGDYEEYTYDDNGNRLTHRKRDGSTLSFTYDALNRMTVKTVPSRSDLAAMYTRDVYYSYDNRDLQTAIRFDSPSGPGSITAWDGFGRQISSTDTMGGPNRTLSYRYDKNGNRIRITHPDGKYWQLEYDGLNRADRMLENAIQIGLMTYNQRGTVKEHKWPYGSVGSTTTPTYDNAGRTLSLTHDLRATAGDVTFGYSYIASGQLGSISRTNEAYAWDGQSPSGYTRAYTTNGLNQYESAGTASFCYDANGNLTADGASVYLYDVENRLVEKRAQGTGNTNCNALSYAGARDAQLLYDPLGRLVGYRGFSSGVIQSRVAFLYDGDAMVAEYDAATGTMLRRYVHGTNVDADDPLIWYEGSAVGPGPRRFLMANHQGSIIGVTDFTGNLLNANSYDEYGIPGTANEGRYQYTGQVWLEELGLYYYKARVYSPQLGRFMQTDPIGYEDQFNLYAYVGNDPINGTDFTGLEEDDEEWQAEIRRRSSKAVPKNVRVRNMEAEEDKNHSMLGDAARFVQRNTPLGAAQGERVQGVLFDSPEAAADRIADGVVPAGFSLGNLSLGEFYDQMGTPEGWEWTTGSAGKSDSPETHYVLRELDTRTHTRTRYTDRAIQWSPDLKLRNARARNLVRKNKPRPYWRIRGLPGGHRYNDHRFDSPGGW